MWGVLFLGVVDFSNLIGLIPSYRTKVWLIRSIAQGLAEIGNVDEAVKVISALPDAAWRLEILSELASFLTNTGECERALKIFMDAKDNDIVLDYLLGIQKCVDENVEKVLDSFKINGERVKRAVSKLGSYRLLDWFGFLTKVGRVDEALEASRGFEEAHYCSEGLMKVAIALAEMGDERYEKVLDEALNAADSISDTDFENIAASAAVEFASVGKGSVALDLAFNIIDDYELADTLINCLPHLEGELFEEAVKDILEIADESSSYEEEEILNKLFPVAVMMRELNKPLLERIIEKGKSEPFHSVLQLIYAFRLLEIGDEEGPKLYEEGMKKLGQVQGEQRVDVAYSLMPFVTRDFVDDFVKYVKEIPDMRDQAMILSKISMSQSVRGEFDSALKIARSITVSGHSSASLSSLAQFLSKTDFERALNIAGEIPDKNWRECIFSLLFAKALEKGEFREDLLQNVLANQARGNEKDTLLILEPAIISLVKAGRKELEDIVKLVSELDHVKNLKNTLTLLAGENVEDALKAAREGLGLAKPLALSVVAVKAYKSKATLSPRRILEEAKREARKIKVIYELDTAYTMIASASAVIGKVEDAIELVMDKVTPDSQERSISILFTLMPIVGRVNTVIRLAPRFLKEMDLPLLQILVHTFEEGCLGEFEKLVDSLISYDFFPLSQLIYYFRIAGETEWAQRLIEKEEEAEDRFYDFSDLGLTLSIKGNVEQAKKAFGKAVEELDKIPKEDTGRKYAVFSIMENVLMSTDESCIDLVKDHLDHEEGKLLSTLFEAYKQASEGRVENAQKIFQDIIDNHPNFKDALTSMATVAGRTGGKTSATLLKELETKIRGILEKDKVSTIMLRFILAGGDPETMVKMVEKNWGGSAEVLLEITSYLIVAGKMETLIKIVESANHYNKKSILRKNARRITEHNPEKALKLAEDLPAYTKDIVLTRIAEELIRKERIEDALNVASKIAVDEDYVQALINILLTFIEKTAKVQTKSNN